MIATENTKWINQDELIARLKANDQQAFEVFVKTNQQLVYNLTLSMIGDHQDAEDISQEVFMDSFKQIGSFEGNSKISTWIYRITINKCLTEIRKRKRRAKWANIISLGLSTTEPQSYNHPGVALENKERASLLLSKLNELPDNQRIAFTLSKVEGLPYQEIAEIMQTSLSSVESYMVRAKKNLQSKLQNYYQQQMI